VPEIEIIDIAENVCNLKKQEADWMLRIDIVEKGDKLEVNWVSLVFGWSLCRFVRSRCLIDLQRGIMNIGIGENQLCTGGAHPSF
jgi:hypothetical protein